MKLFTFLLTLMVGTLLLGADLGNERVLTLPAAEISTLNIDCGAGYLKVNGEPGAKEIRVKAIFESLDIPPAELKDFITQNVELKLEKRGNRAYLISVVNRSRSILDNLFGSGANLKINLEVTVPESLNLEVDDGSGWIEIRAVSGDVEVDDGSGSIVLENIGGTVKIDDGSGEIVVTDVGGDVRIDDGSGDLKVQRVKGDVFLDDGSGDLKINQVEGSVEITDGSGDIEVDLVGKNVIIRESGSGQVEITRVRGEVIRKDE